MLMMSVPRHSEQQGSPGYKVNKESEEIRDPRANLGDALSGQEQTHKEKKGGIGGGKIFKTEIKLSRI